MVSEHSDLLAVAACDLLGEPGGGALMKLPLGFEQQRGVGLFLESSHG